MAQVNASIDAFAAALNESVHKEKLFAEYGARLQVCDFLLAWPQSIHISNRVLLYATR